MINIPAKLRILCKSKNLTRKALAQKSGVSVSCINKIIARGKMPNFKTFYALLSALNVTVSEFFADHFLTAETMDELELITYYRALPLGKKEVFLTLLKLFFPLGY